METAYHFVADLLVVDSRTTVLPVLPGAPRKWTRAQYRKAAHDFRQERFEEREAEARGEEFNDTRFFLSRTGARWFFLRLAVMDDNLAGGKAMARCRSAIFLRNNLGRWPRRERVLKLALPGVQPRRPNERAEVVMKIERDWITKAGFRAVVGMTDSGHRCGYVGVPPGHVLFGVDYSDDCPALAMPAEDEAIGKRGIIPLICNKGEARPDYVFDVHGGITYAGNGKDGNYPVESDLWWFGYDCAHAGDGRDLDFLREHDPKLAAIYDEFHDRDEPVRSQAYCEQECESLAEQFTSRLRVAIRELADNEGKGVGS